MTDLVMDLGNRALIPLTLSLALVLLLRKPIRKLFGAAPAYLLWSLPPLSLLASILPNKSPATEVLILSSTLATTDPGSSRQAAEATMSLAGLLSVSWITGTVVCLLVMFGIYYRFRSRINPLTRSTDDVYMAHGELHSPALVGLWRPSIVIPANFVELYDKPQREMIIEHERQHRRHGDHWANALTTIVQCVFWFHPLIWWAGKAFRADQEMACDARVLRIFPKWPKSYAKALIPELRAQAPGTCQWTTYETLKERIEMITQLDYYQERSASGLIAVAILALIFTGTVWSNGTTSDSPSDELIYFTVQAEVRAEDGSSYEHHFVIGITPDNPGYMEAGLDDGETLRFDFKYDRRDDDLVELSVKISRNDEQIGTPRIRFPIDSPEGAEIRVGNDDGNPRYALSIQASRDKPETRQPRP